MKHAANWQIFPQKFWVVSSEKKKLVDLEETGSKLSRRGRDYVSAKMYCIQLFIYFKNNYRICLTMRHTLL